MKAERQNDLRPRISQREAKFILESLKRSKANVESKLELDPLESEAEKLNGYLQAFGCLIAKYEILASGKKQNGRYTSEVDMADVCLLFLGY